MFTTAPRLRVRRPSPTTVDFTVTTCPEQTLPLRIIFLLLLLLRILLATTTLLLLRAASIAAFPTLRSLLLPAIEPFDRSSAGAALAKLAATTPAAILIPSAAVLLYVLSRRAHASESLLVLRGLGVQTSESGGSYLGGTATRFIPTEKIQDVFVNEAFRGFEVRYYLVVVVEGEEEVVVVFPGLLPGRKIVESVWRGVRECLYERRMEEKGNGS